MLTISNSQQDQLQASLLGDFCDRAVSHLRRIFPEATRSLDATELRQLVSDAIKRSARYGFRTEREVVAFADAMVLLGSGFDEDPRYPWALEILNKIDWTPEYKARLLVETATLVQQREGGSASS